MTVTNNCTMKTRKQIFQLEFYHYSGDKVKRRLIEYVNTHDYLRAQYKFYLKLLRHGKFYVINIVFQHKDTNWLRNNSNLK